MVHELDDPRAWARLYARTEEKYLLDAAHTAHQRILRVSRTIADLAASKKIAPPHVAEALSLRCLDRRS